jgi:hypothetical protein
MQRGEWMLEQIVLTALSGMLAAGVVLGWMKERR